MKNGKPVGVRMIRKNLDNIPPAQLPQGFSFRMYHPGDKSVWIDIWSRADSVIKVDDKLFEETFYGDYESLPERQYFICDRDNQPVGTASAWYGEKRDVIPEVGKLHWVAIVREMQGRGLARPLMTKMLDRMAELGHKSAFLHTQTSRIPAISLYLSYGFQPDIRHDEDRRAWQYVKSQLHDQFQGY